MAPTDPVTPTPTADAADAPPPLRWDGARLHVLDQTLLPAREEVLVLGGAEEFARRLVRRLKQETGNG